VLFKEDNRGPRPCSAEDGTEKEGRRVVTTPREGGVRWSQGWSSGFQGSRGELGSAKNKARDIRAHAVLEIWSMKASCW
jgi:hypothetical protein